MQRLINNYCAIFLLMLCAETAPAAEQSTSGGGEAKKSSDDSRDAAKKGNEQQLNPSMLAHLMKAMQHEKDAQQARQQQNEGKAQEDQQKADREKMKAMMLQNQMKQNDDSADKNKDRGKKATEHSDAPAYQLMAKTFSAPPAGDRKESGGGSTDGPSKSLLQQIAQTGAVAPASTTSSKTASLPDIATMDDYPKKDLASIGLGATPAPKAEPVKDPGIIPPPGKSTISYDNTPAPGKQGSSESRGAAAPEVPAAAGAEAASGGTPPSAPQDRLIAAASAGGTFEEDLFKSMKTDPGRAFAGTTSMTSESRDVKKEKAEKDAFWTTIEKEQKKKADAKKAKKKRRRWKGA